MQVRPSGFFPGKPDVTVIDIKLPDVSGFELMRRIRKDDPDAKIIMFSMKTIPPSWFAPSSSARRAMSPRGRSRMLVKAVRKVAAGDNFISPQLAEAVTFSGASIKANPASQMTAGSWKSAAVGSRRQDRRSHRCAGNFLQDRGQHHSLLKQKLGAKNHSDLIRIAVEMGLG